MLITTQWLRCKAVAGQFSDEFAISGVDYSGQEFSLFAGKDSIVSHASVGDVETAAFVKVDVIDQDGDFVLIRLPAQTFENGQTVTVCRSELEDKPNRQEA